MMNENENLSNQNYDINCSRDKNGYWWDVRLDFVRQFKTELVRLVERLVFEKNIFIVETDIITI
jgi:hypothetical protein